MKTSIRNKCRSCGRPIKRLSDFGTYRDGSVNTEYCRFCYRKGKFIDTGISKEQKIEKNIALAEKMRIPG